ncbi:DALR anticodon-binding domain-containing protein [Sneathiella chinensis]|uniref:arginine--tRNA ligase n=1 Tax=Sneathiella chinensis TaxID=349750 RepID=A0ABQ5UAA2_9PROT|nr:DALR anticodon-binding domain-containing protein [Sneathiella chinensis]GLQ07481.1 hypothetical protein GCM10007924_27020 [Sneathiella chinensis]
MSESYVRPVWRALCAVLEQQAAADPGAEHGAPRPAAPSGNLTLRPPKEESRGDLCSNILLLASGQEEEVRDRLARTVLAAVEAVPSVRSAEVAPNGYVNIHLQAGYWLAEIPVILERARAYGMSLLENQGGFELVRPATTDDLVSARQFWQVEALMKVADLAGLAYALSPAPEDGDRGMATRTAVAKCSLPRVRFALLANGASFARHFSPVRAVDQSYDNPVFAVPYAISRIRSLLAAASAGEGGEDPVDVDYSVLTRSNEQKIAKFMCQWPLALEQSLRNRDIIHLSAFLHDLSLLFFRLEREERLVSSEYLTETGTRPARLGLLSALKLQLCEGLEILGIEMVEE